eukprot:SAG11_NODE_1822_length_4207_cov_1.736125_6_plen_205_part_00
MSARTVATDANSSMRPRWVISRSMSEGALSADQVACLAARADEVWVPTLYHARIFKRSGMPSRIVSCGAPPPPSPSPSPPPPALPLPLPSSSTTPASPENSTALVGSTASHSGPRDCRRRLLQPAPLPSTGLPAALSSGSSGCLQEGGAAATAARKRNAGVARCAPVPARRRWRRPPKRVLLLLRLQMGVAQGGRLRPLQSRTG